VFSLPSVVAGNTVKEIDRGGLRDLILTPFSTLNSPSRTSNAVRIPVRELKQAICDRITPTRDTASSRLEAFEGSRSSRRELRD